MNSKVSHEEFINSITVNGGTILSDKHKGDIGCLVRKTVIQFNDCQIKISYIDLGDHQILVEKSCCCASSNGWKVIPSKCFESNFNFLENYL